MATAEQLTFDLEPGTLAVLAAGPIDGERILLLHGIPTGAKLFRDVLPVLADAGFRALAPDMPGYGRTRLADRADYSLSAVADLYADWLIKERLGPVWLVGHDLGGAVAQLMAVRRPELISRLTLANAPTPTSFPVLGVKALVLAAKVGLFPAIKLVPNPRATADVRRGFSDPSRLTQEMLNDVFWDDKVRTVEGRREHAKHLRHLRNTENRNNRRKLADLPMPILLLWGTDDPYQPLEKTGRQLLALMPEGTPLRTIPRAGHFVPLEKPAEFAQALLEWRRLSFTASPAAARTG